MDLNEISNLIKNDGGKFIIVENGNPTLVIMNFEEYKNKVAKKSDSARKTVNDEKPIQAVENFQDNNPPAGNDDVDIDDLPL